MPAVSAKMLVRECLVLAQGVSCYEPPVAALAWARPALAYAAARCAEWVCVQVAKEWRRCPPRGQDVVRCLDGVAFS